MRSTLPNTDQPRIPHSEYHHTIPHEEKQPFFEGVFLRGTAWLIIIPFESQVHNAKIKNPA